MRVTWGGRGGHDCIQVHYLALWAAGSYRKDTELEEASHFAANQIALKFRTCAENLFGKPWTEEDA